MNPGLHLLHKPVGPTSFSLVRAAIDSVKAAHPGQRPRVCHGGALDPFAHGLLILLVGPATRLFDHLHAIPKTYEATLHWGTETDNGDPLGTPTFTGDPSTLTPDRLDTALATFTGWHDQVPPATSNKRIDGERAYQKAHRGEAVTLPPSRVYLHQATWLSHDLPRQSRFRAVVRGGYYVRALARDLGRLLGCGAHLAALHRTTIGPYADPGPAHPVPITGQDILPWAPTRLLTDNELGDLRHDRPIPAGTVAPPDWTPPHGFPDPGTPIRALHLGKLVCLLKRDGEQLTATAMFARGI